jgi:hypothetical protein
VYKTDQNSIQVLQNDDESTQKYKKFCID